MRRKLLAIALPLLVALGGSTGARAHECPDNDPQNPDCTSTRQAGNWRGNYIPLFDLADRESEDELDRAQRWRDKCEGYDTDGNYYNNQFCIWQDFGNSVFPADTDQGPVPSPNEVHVGLAGSHCFLFEAQHDCEDHQESDPNGVHDAHGGAIYIDICFAPNTQNKFCENGIEDTTIGVTIMDHNGCGLVVPIVACTDEYHVLKPFNGDYTAQQMANTMDWLMDAAADPAGFLRAYFCGYGPGSEDCIYQG